MAEFTHDADFYARIKRYEFVSSSSKLVCIGESLGSYNYTLRDEVYPPDKKFIPVRNRFGSVDYHSNPNYRPATKDKKK